MVQKGKIYLIPNTLGDTPPLEVLPLLVKKAVEHISIFLVENEKNARRFIKLVAPKKSQPQLQIQLINKFTDSTEIPQMLEPCHAGHDIGVISDAGCPAIADPGADVVKEAHQQGLDVVPLVGPSSLLMALMGSGLNGQQFTFNGYLPIDKIERRKTLKQLEKASRLNKSAQLFIETPYRNDSLLNTLTAVLSDTTWLCVACDISLETEYIKTYQIAEWKIKSVDLNKRPTLFILQSD